MSAETGLQAWLASRIESWRQVTPKLASLERSRGDVTTTVLQTRLQRAIEGGPEAPTA